MITLLIKASLAIIVLLAFYKIFLEKESFFAANRAYLLGCLIFSCTLPFIELPKLMDHQGFVTTLIESPEEKDMTSSETADASIEKSNKFRETTTDEATTNKASVDAAPLANQNSASRQVIPNTKIVSPEALGIKDQSAKKGFSYWLILLYFFGVAVLSINFLAQIAHTFWKIYKNEDKIEDKDCVLVNMTSDIEPCSFFKYIFINPTSYDYDTYEQIIAHEKIHVRQGHTIDLLLSELATIVFWFNPFIWVLRKEVEKNIEYQTDDLLIKEEKEAKENYQLNLVKIATYTKPLTITTGYNQSLIKQRILKMNSKKSNPYSYWKYTFVAPVLFILLLFLNEPKIGNAQDLNVPTTAQIETVKQAGPFVKSPAKPVDDCEKLIKAVHEQNITEIKELLETVNLNCIEAPAPNPSFYRYPLNHQPKANTPLTAAARLGYLEIVKLLVEAGADLEFFDGSAGDGWPLIEASKEGHLQVVEFLVEAGADINKLTHNEGSALQRAAEGDRLEVVRYLLEQGADIDAQELGQGSPLNSAAKNGHTAMVAYLIEKGADINASNDWHGTALQAAAQNEHYETVELLVSKGADINIQDDGGDSALKAAAGKGNQKIVEFLLAKGADINLQDKKRGMTALFAAAWYGRTEIVEFLLAKGANINLLDNLDGTALVAASRNGHLETVELLLSKGANIDLHPEGLAQEPTNTSQLLFYNQTIRKVENDNQCTALIIAAKNGHTEIVKLLLAKGANIDLQTQAQGSALNAAARNEQDEIVALLLSNGANINLQNEGQGTPLNAAARNGNYSTVELLLAKGADLEKQNDAQGSALNAAARNGQRKTVELLLANGADINAENAGQGSALNAAARYGQDKIVELLLAKGADINAQNETQGSALNAAARNGQSKTVELLLAKGADINMQNEGQGTALHAAARNGHLETVKLLVTNGADVNLPSNGEGSAIDAAYRNAHQHVVRYLESKGAKRFNKD